MESPTPFLAAEEEWQPSIHKELKMAWIALKALGLLPFFVEQPPASGGRKIAVYAVQAAYALGIYMAYGAFAIERAISIKEELSDSIVNAVMYLSILVPHLLVGPLQWISMPNVLGFLNDWNAFQECFLRVTGHQLLLKMFWLSSITIVSVVVFCIGGALLLAYLILERDFKGSLYYMYAASQINVLLAVWVLLCLASAKAADQLVGRLKEDLAIPGANSGDIISGYQSAWLRLSQLTRDIGDVFCHVFYVIVIFWLTQTLLAAFQGAKLMANDCPMTMYLGIGGLAINSFISMLVFCNAANYATNSVSSRFVKSLTEFQVETASIQKQLHDLAQAVATHGAVINLGGFYVVNRSLLVSMMAAFVTYMIVLVQSASTDSEIC